MVRVAHISLEEYGRTSYRPDREYIDGVLRERSVGKWEHARLLALIAGWMGSHERPWACIGATSFRVTVSPTRVRVPDVVLFSAVGAIGSQAPLLVVEILSPEDTYADVQERTNDYLGMGVENVWIIDPTTRTGRMSKENAWVLTDRFEVSGTPIYVDLPALFAQLQRPGMWES